MPVRALIFDVDGTLAETEEFHRAAFNAVFAAEGRAWRWDKPFYGELLKVMGGKERLRHFAEIRGIDLSEAELRRLHAAKNVEYAQLMRSGACRLRPGVEDVIRGAAGRGLKLAVATTTSRVNLEELLAATLGPSGMSLFAATVCGDEAAQKKPAPDVYIKALELLGIPAEACLAFEDTRNGLLAARAAGIATIITPNFYTEGEDFSGALEVRADLVGFEPG